ncbi:MAG: iron-containing alcohol dehydrogenase family protein [Sporolactobacillus sp.]
MSLISRIAPQQYLLEEGAYDFLSEAIEQLFLKKILFLHGEKSFRAAFPYLPDVQSLPAQIVDAPFGGQCSEEEIQRLIQIVHTMNVDSVIGLGGGKVLDTAKAVAYRTGNLPLLLLPTLASNCAAWSALSVIYGENGISLGHRIYPKQANLLLIEPRVIAASPVRYFIAGIADTLAKWYETEQLLAAAEARNLAIRFAHQSARLCRDVPLQHGLQAVHTMRLGKMTPDWTLVMETNIMASGLVGGFADQFGRATAAHSVHDALTSFQETKHLLHGEKVAYGILVQLAFEEKREEIQRLVDFYKKLHLPICLADLGLANLTEQGIQLIAEQTVMPDKTIHLLPYDVTKENVIQAIFYLERLAT